MNRKYFQPSAYLRKVRFTIAKVLLLLKIPLKVRTRVDSAVIAFVTTSYTEYVLRARESFRREEVTMYWLRNIVNPTDVVYDIGANVGPYSLYAGHKIKTAKKIRQGHAVAHWHFHWQKGRTYQRLPAPGYWA